MKIKEVRFLEKLELQKQLTYAFLSCKRFFPNYLYFSNNYEFGNPTILEEAIELVYNGIFNNKTELKVIEDFLTKVNLNAPHPENFSTFYASIAMYTSGIVYESVNLLKNKDTRRILHDISMMSIDAVDLFIQERDSMDYNDPEFEAKILNDNLMKTEVAIQKGIITYLHQIDLVKRQDIESLLLLQKQGTGTLIL